ncbi:Alpha/Beta hydrolase fold [Arabidopsis thaliana x Arabidopsis arenosa]|uniref:Alpha/Beta hydrolase fold n=1 Tax=Arabidopsis thaliana x Arabidopsis arenosa TaxID=1240361 RepID=A0A8T1ZKY6_9BRAS|nr:Alpha/Beta hydrolase fold [Arabidopsis thaliana x Arabidopsis arenosa]
MAKKKKKGSRRPRPKLPGSSQFARLSSVVGISVKPRDSASGDSPATVSDPGSSSPRTVEVGAPPVASVAAPLTSPSVSSPDLASHVASISGTRNFPPSPSEILPPLISGPPLVTVEAFASGPASPEIDGVASPGHFTSAQPTEKALLGLGKKWTSLFDDSSQLQEVGSPTTHISGVPFVLIPDDNIAAAREEFKDFIFAQFQGNPPEMGRVIGVVNALWARSGPRIFVHNIGPGAFLLRVTNPRTRAILLGRNVWNIAGFPMFVSPWSPEFTPDSPPITTATITVELRGVPYLLFNNQSLSRLATAVGKPIGLAPETARKENFEVAKVMVRVDLTKSLPAKIISGFSNGREVEIDVSYPWLPPRCSECSAYGHDFHRCPTRPVIPLTLRRRRTRSRSRPRNRRRSRQGRSSDRGVLASAQNSNLLVAKSKPTQLVWKVKSVEAHEISESMATQAVDDLSAKENFTVSQEEIGSTTKILEWLAVENYGLPTEDVTVSSPAFDSISIESNAPFFLVSNKKSGRKDFTREWISIHKPLFGAFLETHIQPINAGRVIRAIPVGWNFLGNFDHHSTARIVVCWDPSVSIVVYQASAQLITCGFFIQSRSLNITVSFAYGHNLPEDRVSLWEEMKWINANSPVNRFPWAVVGDFNQILRTSQHSEYLYQVVDSSGIDDFNFALQDAELFEAQSKGLPFSWWNSQEDSPSAKKIDHALINQSWASLFPDSYADFLEPLQSDHAACFFHVPSMHRSVRKPFKFFQHVMEHPEFLDSVTQAWNPISIQGSSQFKLVRSLRKLKIVLRLLNKRHYSGITQRVKAQAAKVANLQRLLLSSPDAQAAREEHQERALWQTLISAEERFFRQKSRVIWLHLGDRNTSFFHKSVSQRAARNHIHFLCDQNDRKIVDISEIKTFAASYFEGILGSTDLPISPVTVAQLQELLPFRCTDSHAQDLQKLVTPEEIKTVLFSMPLNKTVQEFFRNGRLLKDLNCTIIALIPKVPEACKLGDFRPISCCNLIYKVISKIIANRMKPILQECVSPNQAAFLKGRSLGENVLLASELIRNYQKVACPKSCMVKVDIRKAFDTVCWDFVLKVLSAQNFPPIFCAWIKQCISSPRFSVSINGELAGFFPAEKGHRQGDPISPYLFIMVMEVLSKLLEAAASQGKIQLHPLCSTPLVTHLLFADDLLVFSDGAGNSLTAISEVMINFKRLCGLDMNPSKSEIFFGGYSASEVEALSVLSGIKVGTFPTRYLGLPLNPARISFATLQPFIEKITSKLHAWTVRYLSFAGKIRLISSVIYGMVNFWSAVFNLPKRFYSKVDSICAAFLWKNKVDSAVGARVAWKDVCKPKEEGGLGIRHLEDFQIVFQLKLIWNLFANAGSLWVAWLNGNVFHRYNFWILEESQRLSRTVNCMIKLKPLLKDFLRCEIGNGQRASFWFDHWCDLGPLIDLLGVNGPRQLRISKTALVLNAVQNGDWWMLAARSEAQQSFMTLLTTIPPPNDSNGSDIYLWRRSSGTFDHFFSSKETWEQIRSHTALVPWCKAVWFKEAVPHYSFITWLAMQGRLPTKDRLRAWGLNVTTDCVLCSNGIETHAHLFFDCAFSATIWEDFASRIWPSPPSGLQAIASWILLARSQPSSQAAIIIKLFLQAATYLIWRERNARIFTGISTASTAIQASLDRSLRDRLLSFPGSASSSSSLLAFYFGSHNKTHCSMPPLLRFRKLSSFYEDTVNPKAKQSATVEKPKRRRSGRCSCVDSCCWLIGYLCTAWWLLLFLYHSVPVPAMLQAPESPGTRLSRDGVKALHPVILVPGIVTGGLELWEGRPCAEGLFRKRLWGASFTEILRRPLCWLEHLSLDSETGLDPPGIRVRAVPGLVAADYFAPCYFAWAVLIENLAKIGYEGKNLHMASYDWRLSFHNTEVRDQSLSRLKSKIELMYATNGYNKVVVVPHSVGAIYFLHFLKWVETPLPDGGGGGPGWCAKHIKAVVNIGPAFLGVPKAVSNLLSAEGKDIAFARSLAPGLLDSELLKLQTLEHLMRMSHSWDSIVSLLPKGGEAIWGDLDSHAEEGNNCIHSKRKSPQLSLSSLHRQNYSNKPESRVNEPAKYGRIISFGKRAAELPSSQLSTLNIEVILKNNSIGI